MKSPIELVRAKAPLRISFAGGGTDVSPYSEREGGAVFSSTIDKYAYCTIKPRSDDQINVHSLDMNRTESWSTNGEFKYDGNLDLFKAVLKHFPCETGFDAFLHTDAPPGSGLGSSSAVIVSIIGAFKTLHDVYMNDYDTAKLAYKLEREELGYMGGKQDQYASVFGGFNYMEFTADTIVTPIKINREVINEFNYCTLLCYTGKTRDSGQIIQHQTAHYLDGDYSVLLSMQRSKELAMEMKNAFLKGDVHLAGEILEQAWQYKKNFDQAITNMRIDDIYNIAKANGAIGGKISGAGGGGYMYFICDYDRKHRVSQALAQLGVTTVPFNFELKGLQTWKRNL